MKIASTVDYFTLREVRHKSKLDVRKAATCHGRNPATDWLKSLLKLSDRDHCPFPPGSDCELIGFRRRLVA